jgi:PAS domain S-box-containing protein
MFEEIIISFSIIHFLQYEGDIDLSDIFAEYLNDGTDPLTTFSNYGGMQLMQHPAVVPVPETPSTASLTLPTGGIRTAFHSSAVPNTAQPAYQQQAHNTQHNAQDQLQQMQQQSQQFQMQSQQQQQPHEYEPTEKKAKIEDQQYSQFQQQAAVPTNVSTSGSGITGRLGYSVEGGQLTIPNKNSQAAFQPGATSAQSGVQLPIGVGIRVAGVAAANGAGAMNNVQYGTTSAAPGHAERSGHMPLWAGGGGGGLSEHAVAERRQRNREHAKRSRVRKKFLLESLQADVRELQVENGNLRMVIQSKIPLQAQQIISECCVKNPLFDDSNDNRKDGGGQDANGVELDKSDYSLIHSLTSGQQNFVLSDPRLPDNPIVYASDGFYQLTGYTREQVLGRNCRFLQGPGTDPKAVDVIRTAVANGTDATTCLLNYKADGTPFWNQFFVAALRDSDNCIVNYVSNFFPSIHLAPLFYGSFISQQHVSIFLNYPGWCPMCHRPGSRSVSTRGQGKLSATFG